MTSLDNNEKTSLYDNKNNSVDDSDDDSDDYSLPVRITYQHFKTRCNGRTFLDDNGNQIKIVLDDNHIKINNKVYKSNEIKIYPQENNTYNISVF